MVQWYAKRKRHGYLLASREQSRDKFAFVSNTLSVFTTGSISEYVLAQLLSLFTVVQFEAL